MAKRQNREIHRIQEKDRGKQAEKPGQTDPVMQAEETDWLARQRVVGNPDIASPADIAVLQQSYGNQAVQRLLAQRQPEDIPPATRPGGGLIQRAMADQVAPITDWPEKANGPFCTSAVWWWAAKEAAGGNLAMTIDLALKIPTQFATLMAFSEKKRKFLFFEGDPKKTNLQTSMPSDGTVLLWEGNGEMVDTGRHHAAVVKGGKICGYNQGGIAQDAGTGYTELDAAMLFPVAASCYTIPASKMVDEARKRIVKAK